ncbi:VanW family protein [Neopoerus faecalis]|uniref:VanW family protein n=1 Tax=Neopoerus faecalis TaxID=3032125 RepID=UPI00256FF76F|nr:VanW family protein [Neopoerus faecalis]
MEPIREADVQTQPGKRLAEKTEKRGSKRPWMIAVVIAAVLVAAYLALCAYAGSLDTFYPNRHINGIDVGGLTVSEAQSALETRLPAQTIILVNEERQLQTTLTVAELGYTAESFAGDAQFWMDAERDTPFLRRGWAYLATLSGHWPGGAHWPDMNEAVLTKTVARLTEVLTEPPADTSGELDGQTLRITKAHDGYAPESLRPLLSDIASYSQSGYTIPVTLETLPARDLTAQQLHDRLHGEMKNASYDAASGSIVPEQFGADFDVAAAQTALDGAVPGETVSVPAVIEEPEVTASDLKMLLFRDVLGEARTHVSGSAGRIGNVKLSAKLINGIVLNSGDTFSYNDSVGKRTEARGFKPAPAYVKGETVDEVGGGICQTSSTLYLACLLSNMEITERYAHRYVPAYIDWGMDATVSWGGPDYKFTNNTLYPVKIVTEYSKGYLTIKLLGTNIDGIRVKMTNEVLSKTPWETVYQEDSTMAPGSPDVVKVTPYTGYKVKTYQTIYDKNGSVIDSHFEAASDYKVRNKVVLQAPAAAPGSAPADLPADTPAPSDTPAETPQQPEPAPTPDPEPETPTIVVTPDSPSET